MSSAEELNGEVRGFSGIFTDRYEGFTERTVDELYRIAVNIENSDKYAAASKILKEIYKHLDGEYTHDFKLNSTDILNQLYQTYVDAGYDKSKDEFIEDVSKNIQIGTTEDIAAGINDSKAVDSVAWRRYWLEHLKSLGAHINIRNSISPNQCVNSYPIFYFDSNQKYMKPTYHLTDKWNSDGLCPCVFTLFADCSCVLALFDGLCPCVFTLFDGFTCVFALFDGLCPCWSSFVLVSLAGLLSPPFCSILFTVSSSSSK